MGLVRQIESRIRKDLNDAARRLDLLQQQMIDVIAAFVTSKSISTAYPGLPADNTSMSIELLTRLADLLEFLLNTLAYRIWLLLALVAHVPHEHAQTTQVLAKELRVKSRERSRRGEPIGRQKRERGRTGPYGGK